MKKENARPTASSKGRPCLRKKRDPFSEISKDTECTILITCKPPRSDGSLQIEMNYTGKDFCLASLMIEQAQKKIEQDFLESEELGESEELEFAEDEMNLSH